MNGSYPSKRQMKKAFREGKGVYDDGQSSYSVRCQEARARGRLPMTQAVKLLREIARRKGIKVTIAAIKRALIMTHDREWHHCSKYGNRVMYYDPLKALTVLPPEMITQSNFELVKEKKHEDSAVHA